MATSQTETFLVENIRVCSICFEKFKTPRYLPCKHSFCHGCLSSYIVSQCKSTKPRLGFHCPLCRVYIPSHGDPEKPEEWVVLYPVNDVLQKLVAEADEKYCEPCLRDNEKEETSDYCLTCNEYLCMLCAKCHRKSMASRDHIIIKINEMLSIQIVPEGGPTNGCPKHNHETIQMYCYDHEQPCCGLCVGTEHRKCEKVDTVENAAQCLRESEQMDTMLCEMNAFKKKLLKVKTDETFNISEIENAVDNTVAKTEEEVSAIVQHIEQLKLAYLDELFLSQKNGREQLQREIEKIEDGIFCIDKCKEEIEKAQGTKNGVEMIMNFFTAKEKFHKIKQSNFKRIQLKLSSEKKPSWMKITTEMTKIADVKLSVFSRPLKLDISAVELTKFKEFPIENGNVYSGLFLSRGRFLVVKYNGDETCVVYDQNWDCIHVIDGLKKPYSAVQCKEEIFVTNTVSNTVDVFSSDDFHKIRKFHLNSNIINGISCWEENIYVACGNQILKINRMGQIMQKYVVNGRNIIHITTTTSGLIVYSDWKIETVTAINDEGCKVWKYQTCNLKHPRELDVDSNDNIYIAGSKSNNIHVLSSSGKLIRVIENIPNPTFCKINEYEGTMCVCSGNEIIKLYQFQSSE